MNLTRIILDGIAMCVVFNAVVGLFSLIMPQAYSVMFPKKIKEAAAPYVDRKQVRHMHIILLILYLSMFVYMAASARAAGMTGFRNLFWAGYIEMFFVNVGDFVLLDCLGRIYVKDKDLVKGAEGNEGWEWSEWKKLAIPEHGLVWPIIICPLVGLIVAGLGALM